jgi:hypothetical protein
MTALARTGFTVRDLDGILMELFQPRGNER